MQPKQPDNFVETPVAGTTRSHRRVSIPQGEPSELVHTAELSVPDAPESPDALAAEDEVMERPATAEEVAELEDSPEQVEKKKRWLIRVGQAAVINFRIIQEVGVKAYAEDLADRAVEAVDNKVDSIKDGIYKKVEATFRDIENDVNSTARSVREQYALTVGPIESSIKAYKEMRQYKRDLARYEKAKREQAIKDRAAAIKQGQENRRLAKKAPGL